MVVVCACVVQEMAAAVSGEGGVQALEEKINNMPKVCLTVVSLCHPVSVGVSLFLLVSAGVMCECTMYVCVPLTSPLLQLVQRDREVLTETLRMLDEEEREDSELRSRFKEKWTRQPSGALAENLRKEVRESGCSSEL